MTELDNNMKNQERIKRVASLNAILGDEFGLFTKTLNYHWNIEGPRFHSLHTFLETSYRELLEVLDDVAERARMLGGPATGTVKNLLDHMSIKEKEGAHLSTNDMLTDLLNSHVHLEEEIKRIRNSNNWEDDPGTEDFLIGLLRKHEKTSWMIRSHLL